MVIFLSFIIFFYRQKGDPFIKIDIFLTVNASKPPHVESEGDKFNFRIIVIIMFVRSKPTVGSSNIYLFILSHWLIFYTRILFNHTYILFKLVDFVGRM